MTERFTLLTELGRGGMGVVWKARDEETGQIVAFKSLRDIYAEDAGYVTRFERELELAKRIHSDNVVQVLGYGVREGTPYLALEYVDGPSLRERLTKHGPYSWNEARQLLTQIAEGLADAHATGVIHRDLKPSNILIGSDGVAKIADFGIAKGLDLTRVTGTSTLLGTPAYLPPEGPADQRSDLYSLGVIGYELLTGVVPFEGRTYQDVILAHVRTPPDLGRLSVEARPIIGWLLAKDPASRPQTARQLVRALAGVVAVPAAAPASVATPPNVSAGPPIAPGWHGVGPDGLRSASQARRQAPILVGVAVVAVVAVLGTMVAVSAARTNSGATPTATPGDGRSGGVAGASSSEASASSMQADAATPLAATPVPPAPAGQWHNFGTLPAYHWGDGLAQLANGTVSVFSACVNKACNTATTKTWVLDPSSARVVSGPGMVSSQLNPTVTVFNDGKSALITGGINNGQPVSSAEVLDLTTGLFSGAPPMSIFRYQATATDIGNGRVLVAGGWVKMPDGSKTATASAEVFDLSDYRWHPAAGMSVPRALAVATRLSDGRVLVAGGDQSWKGKGAPNTQGVLASAEIYDPQANSWSGAGTMSTQRAGAAAALLPNGDVMVVGGWADGHERAQATTDRYTPGVGWQAGTMPGAHALFQVVVLKNGRVLAFGGLDANNNATYRTEVFDPSSGWSRDGDMKKAAYRPAGIALADGRALMVGGEFTRDTDLSNRIDLYQP